MINPNASEIFKSLDANYRLKNLVSIKEGAYSGIIRNIAKGWDAGINITSISVEDY